MIGGLQEKKTWRSTSTDRPQEEQESKSLAEGNSIWPLMVDCSLLTVSTPEQDADADADADAGRKRIVELPPTSRVEGGENGRPTLIGWHFGRRTLWATFGARDDWVPFWLFCFSAQTLHPPSWNLLSPLFNCRLCLLTSISRTNHLHAVESQPGVISLQGGKRAELTCRKLTQRRDYKEPTRSELAACFSARDNCSQPANDTQLARCPAAINWREYLQKYRRRRRNRWQVENPANFKGCLFCWVDHQQRRNIHRELWNIHHRIAKSASFDASFHTLCSLQFAVCQLKLLCASCALLIQSAHAQHQQNLGPSAASTQPFTLANLLATINTWPTNSPNCSSRLNTLQTVNSKLTQSVAYRDEKMAKLRRDNNNIDELNSSSPINSQEDQLQVEANSKMKPLSFSIESIMRTASEQSSSQNLMEAQKLMSEFHSTRSRSRSRSKSKSKSRSRSRSNNSSRSQNFGLSSEADSESGSETRNSSPLIIDADSASNQQIEHHHHQSTKATNSKCNSTIGNSTSSPCDPRLAHFQCRLDNEDMWHRFHPLDTEMIITKQGR